MIPFSILTTIYGKIFLYLRKHRIVREERPRDRQKARRTNIMLGTVLNNIYVKYSTIALLKYSKYSILLHNYLIIFIYFFLL